ncbi:Penicillin-binding protein E [uncultured Clostridium sp.]|uniref:serine hydrolase domain-containing protein n=1 Tax=uncultured Clostridium sp. TaxID=59620 RepID=UPI0008220030|nr:serine hydrolase domain-containing protein [uncultured Clostridium sp.]SCK04426.1 Penicillin-binding protein E [uncultured Clostridium sp.]
MKKRYILLVIGLTISSLLTLSGCSNKKTVDDSQINIIRDEATEEVEKSNDKVDENNVESENKVESKKSETEYKNVEKIVEAGYESVEEFLDQEAANKAFQGVALVAVGDEIKFAKAYGYADADEKIENTLTTRFAIASNTKQFTAAAIMQLVEQNKVKLDDTIDKYFPKYEYGCNITVRQLLQMRSGIPDYLNDVITFMQSEDALSILKDYKDDVYFDKYVEDERWSPDVILNSLYLTPLLFTPGEAYDYCNTNYYLLGLIIEQASGMSFEDYIEKNIFDPAGMETSSMKAEESDAKGHGSVESGEIAANPNFTYAAGNIYANVYDMLRWNRMLHKGNIVSEQSYNEMITPVDGYGYGLFINEGIIRHSGVIDGFNSNTEYDINSDVTIIVMENSDATTSLLDAKYDTSMIRGLITK